MQGRSFLEKLSSELTVAGKAPSTVHGYVACAREFVLHADTSVSRLGRDHIARFLVHLSEERGLAPSTLKVYVYAVRFLFSVTLGRPSLVRHLKAPRVTPPPAVVLSPAEVERFFAGFRVRTYRTLACLLYGTGVRLGEGLALTVADIDASRGVIRVTKTKVRRPRMARLSDALLSELRSYWRAVRPPGPLLFPGQDPRVPLNPTTVRQAFKRAAEDSGLPKAVTPHVLRHTYATHLLEAGVDLHTVQLLLGHANLSATLRYLHVSTAHLAGRLAPLHPLLGTR